MTFKLAPMVTMSLVLLFLFVFAYSAEAEYCCRRKFRRTSISGYIPYKVFGDEQVFYLNSNRLTALPDSNSAVKAVWRGARVRTSPNNYFIVGEASNVTDDSGHRFNGAFALLGSRNQSSDSSRLTIASGTGDFSNVNGGSHAQYFSSSYYRVAVSLVFGVCK